MFLIVAGVLFAVFVANILSGALAGGVFLSDVNEMLILFAAAVAFTVAILKRERMAIAKSTKKNHDQ